jgi:hypothetical protein
VKVWSFLPCWILQVQIPSVPRKLTKFSYKILTRQQASWTAAVVFRNQTTAVDLWAAELGGIALKYKIKDCKTIQILLLLVSFILHYVRSKSNLNLSRRTQIKYFTLLILPDFRNSTTCKVTRLRLLVLLLRASLKLEDLDKNTPHLPQSSAQLIEV